MNNTLQETIAYNLETIKKQYIPSKEDDINYTDSANEWIESIKRIDIGYCNSKGTGLNENRVTDTFYGENCVYNFDYEIIKQASGYVVGPAFKYKGDLKTTSHKVFRSLEDMKEYLKDKKYLLHMIFSYILTTGCEDTSFKVYKFDNPEMRYIFRGHIL